MIDEVSILTTSHEKGTISTIGKLTTALSKDGFIGRKGSHIHPGGNQVPSGYYLNILGNPMSMMPIDINDPASKDGDAANARAL